MSVEFKIQGLRELEQILKQLPDRAQRRALVSGARAGARVIGTEARARVPVDTGTLRRSIRWALNRQESNRDRASFDIGFTKAAYYGRFIELGTAKMAARPFLRPAIEAMQAQAVQAFAKQMQVAILREAKKL